ncbi:MAG: pyridoxine 5'-phosphate synthase [Pelagibacteraceae bacterium]|nr:pyridoxine 5'-phosphate synthase [Pelagibacteraceae bacterium]MCI5079253.1 pyridoxine 5'-phosphate synthase [Pelagibacteraceae bacterium]
MKTRLGVNIDHVATLRNARGEGHPDIAKAANEVIKNGADLITIHVREDQRHIKKSDAIFLKKKIKKPINLEMAPTIEMLNFALKLKPKYVCIVPEKRKEITTEGGLNLNQRNLKKIINKLKSKGIEVSLFINPKTNDVKRSFNLGSNAIEIHTGSFASAFKNRNKNKIKTEFDKIKNCQVACNKTTMKFNVGHGLTYESATYLKKLNNINEFNIGHFIVGESLFVGFSKVVKKFKRILKN